MRLCSAALRVHAVDGARLRRGEIVFLTYVVAAWVALKKALARKAAGPGAPEETQSEQPSVAARALGGVALS